MKTEILNSQENIVNTRLRLEESIRIANFYRFNCDDSLKADYEYLYCVNFRALEVFNQFHA